MFDHHKVIPNLSIKNINWSIIENICLKKSLSLFEFEFKSDVKDSINDDWVKIKFSEQNLIVVGFVELLEDNLYIGVDMGMILFLINQLKMKMKR